MGVARKMQKNRKDCLAKEILLGATGGRDKVEFGIGEECISRTSGHGQKRWFMWRDIVARQILVQGIHIEKYGEES